MIRGFLLVFIPFLITPSFSFAQRFDPIPVPEFQQSTRINHPEWIPQEEFDEFLERSRELGLEIEVDDVFSEYSTKILCDEELWKDLLKIARKELLEGGAEETGIPKFLLNISLGTIEMFGYDLIDFVIDDVNERLDELFREDCEGFNRWIILEDQTVIADQCFYHGLGDDAPQGAGDFPALCELIGLEAWIAQGAPDIPDDQVYVDIFWEVPNCECTRTIYPGFDSRWIEENSTLIADETDIAVKSIDLANSTG